jgi:hypothetical protein
MHLTALLAISSAVAAAKNRSTKTETVTWGNGREEIVRPLPINSLGADIVKVRGACLAWDAYFVAPEFFRKLKRADTSGGIIFRRGRRTVSGFPDVLKLHVDVAPGRCSQTAPSVPSWPGGDWPPEFIKAPHAEAIYVRDFKPCRLEIDLAEEGDMPGDFPIFTPWEYWFVVKTKGVHLMDQMRFTLFSKTGKKLAEFNYRP